MVDIDKLYDEPTNDEWMNYNETSCYKKYHKLIDDLINLKEIYKKEDHDYLLSNNGITKHAYESKSFHFFIFGINWNDIYLNSDKRLTIYDIFIYSATRKPDKKKKEFLETYNSINELFQGRVKTKAEAEELSQTITHRFTACLKELLGNKEHKSKGLNEFFKMIFSKLIDNCYNEAIALKDEYQSSRFLIDFFDHFIPAFETTKIFNKQFKHLLPNVITSDFFPLHVLLRHFVSMKFYYIQTYNNGETISTDGVFYPPNFSTNEADYIKSFASKKQLKFEDIALALYNKLSLIIPIFTNNINRDFSPNIIFFEDSLYGIEYNKFNKENIEIASFYPLNNDQQLEGKISQQDYGRITNRSNIPDRFMFEDNLLTTNE